MIALSLEEDPPVEVASLARRICGETPVFERLAGDASPRVYWRVRTVSGTRILLDASAEPPAQFRQWLATGQRLFDAGLRTPAVLGFDLDLCCCLMEDLGGSTLSTLLAAGASPDAPFAAATEALLRLWQVPRDPELTLECRLPLLHAPLLAAELDVFLDWHLPRRLGREADASERAEFIGAWLPLLERAAQGPQSVVHRDFHSGNLLPDPHGGPDSAVGIIDYQDMALGPWLYDVVSLVEDVRRDVSQETRAAVLRNAKAHLGSVGFRSAEDWEDDLAILGAQRSLRVIGVCARLCSRDGKPRYLADVPRVSERVRQSLMHHSLGPVRDVTLQWL